MQDALQSFQGHGAGPKLCACLRRDGSHISQSGNAQTEKYIARYARRSHVGANGIASGDSITYSGDFPKCIEEYTALVKPIRLTIRAQQSRGLLQRVA
jgi:hypothetical protein